MTSPARDLAWTAADGTSLAGRIHEPPGATGLPVLCLPGLTRNGRDFDRLVDALTTGPAPRTVITMDFRGRGRSGHAGPATYRPDVEAADTLAGLTHLGVSKAAFVGTSRGGIVSMILAMTAPAVVGPVVLNDIGPVIELSGLRAIKARIGTMAGDRHPNWVSAVSDLKATMGRTFTSLTDDDWLAVAHQMYRRGPDGRPVLDYDPALVAAFATFDESVGLPPFWPAYDALGERPVLVIRGENSDLLSEETVAEMARRLPNVAVHRVPGEGHAPLLWDAPTLDRIRAFLSAA